MLLCLWEGCKMVFDDPTALHEHFNKHGQEEHLEELHLDKLSSNLNHMREHLN
jgi:hypothetical protein